MCSEWKVPERDPTSGCNIEHWTLTGVQLYHSPDEYNKVYGCGAFDKYYSTTSGGENITVTKRHHKRNLTRTFHSEKVCEAHIDFKHANAADEVCADERILTDQFHLLGIEKPSGFQVVVYGSLQRDVDRAGAFIQGKYDKEVPPSKRRRPGLHAVPSCSPNVHEDFADSSHRIGSSFYIGTAKTRNKFQYVCTDRMSNRCPVYEDEQNGLVMSKQEDDYWYAIDRTGNQHCFRTKEDPRFDGAHHWEQCSKRGWISFGEYLTTPAQKKVKLSNLPPDMTLDELRATAEDYGQVVAVKISEGLTWQHSLVIFRKNQCRRNCRVMCYGCFLYRGQDPQRVSHTIWS
jgi:hypothetical protein